MKHMLAGKSFFFLFVAAMRVGVTGAQYRCTETSNRASDGDCDDGGPGAGYPICADGTECIGCGVQFPPPPPSSQSASDWDLYVWLEFGNVLLRLGTLGFAVRWRPKRLGLHMLIGAGRSEPTQKQKMPLVSYQPTKAPRT